MNQLLGELERNANDSTTTLFQFLNSHRRHLPLSPLHLPFLDETRLIQPGNIIHILGPRYSAKTEICYHLACVSLMPRCISLGEDARSSRRYRQFELGGKNQGVVWLDLDGKFDIGRLKQVMRSWILGLLNVNSSPAVSSHAARIEETIQECLRKLILYTPTTMQDVSMILLHLPVVLNRDSQYLYSMVIIDSLASNRWMDRIHGSSSSETQYKRLLKAWKRLNAQIPMTMFCTTTLGLAGEPSTGVWSKSVDQRYHVTKSVNEHSASTFQVTCSLPSMAGGVDATMQKFTIVVSQEGITSVV